MGYYSKQKFMVLDLETTGLPIMQGFNCFMHPGILESYDSSRIIQIAWQVLEDNNVLCVRNYYINPQGGFFMDPVAESIHGISSGDVIKRGIELNEILKVFRDDLFNVQLVVGHNIAFDYHVLLSEILRQGETWSQLAWQFGSIMQGCTMIGSVEYCNIFRACGYLKWPKLSELFSKLFPDEDLVNAHDASIDVEATVKCFLELRRLRIM